MLNEQFRKSTFSHTNGCVECRFVPGLEARWVKASASGANGCVEARWQKAPASGSSDCVEVAIDGEGTAQVRDSKLGDASPILQFTAVEWASLLMDVAAGHFHWSRFAPLQFDATEKAAFEAGVVAGEFDAPATAVPRPLYPELGDDLKRAGEQAARHKAGLA